MMQQDSPSPYAQQVEGFLPCPFCGTAPVITKQGNDHTKKRALIVSCPECRIQRTDAAIHYGFDWLMLVAMKNWNKRANESNGSQS